MKLFEDTEFFLLLGVMCLPAIWLGVRERSIRYWGMIATAVFCWLAMKDQPQSLVWLAAYLILELAIVKGYLYIRKQAGRVAWHYRLALLASIAPLMINKITQMGEQPLHWMAFLGISYMTFKTAQIVIETYDGLIEEEGTLDFLYLILFFPSITSGPIDRSRRFASDLEQTPTRDEYLNMVGEGLFKIVKGLFYKQVLGGLLFALMEWIRTSWSMWSGLIAYMYAYGFYLFFDFAGYSCMAIGTAYIFGVRMPENFRAPFLAKDIKDFWDRWHMTLSYWFRDYLFSRITMSLIRQRKIKDKLTIASIAFMVNMGVMGMWHGLTLDYIAYGLYHGFLLSLCERYQKKSRFHKKHKKEKWYIFLQWFVTFQLVMFGFLIFSGRLSQVLGL